MRNLKEMHDDLTEYSQRCKHCNNKDNILLRPEELAALLDVAEAVKDLTRFPQFRKAKAEHLNGLLSEGNPWNEAVFELSMALHRLEHNR